MENDNKNLIPSIVFTRSKSCTRKSWEKVKKTNVEISVQIFLSHQCPHAWTDFNRINWSNHLLAMEIGLSAWLSLCPFDSYEIELNEMLRFVSINGKCWKTVSSYSRNDEWKHRYICDILTTDDYVCVQSKVRVHFSCTCARIDLSKELLNTT